MERSRVWLMACCVVVGLLGSVPGPAAGQEKQNKKQKDERLPEKGRYSVLFGLPTGGGTTFGIWKMISTRFNLGLDVEFDLEDRETVVFGGGASDTITDTRWTLRAGPQLKWYFPVGSSVVPYGRVGLLGGYGRRDAESPAATREIEQVSVLLRVGLGVEWFPVQWVSFGGFTGLLFSYDDITDQANGSPLADSSRWRLTTFHSGLGIQIYF